jgi:signal peptidase I
MLQSKEHMSFPSDETSSHPENTQPPESGLRPTPPNYDDVPGTVLTERWPADPGLLIPATADGVDPWLANSALGEDGEDEAAKEARSRRSRRLGIELVQTLILAMLIFFAVRTMAQNFKVEGSSMEPGLHDGQYLLVNKAVYFRINTRTLARVLPFIHVGDNPERYLFHGPHRGDVIVFRYPNDPRRDFIKRVIGIPGDTVEIQAGTLMINGKQVPESFIEPGSIGTTTAKVVVPAGQYYVLGDNRNNSSDSRAWGFVPADNVIGQAMFSYWPFDTMGGAGNKHFNLGSILPFDISLPVSLHLSF